MTNGSLVDDALLNELDARNCHPELNMSFDGPREWHDWLLGVEGAYDSVRRAHARCRDHGFPTGTVLVLHRGNVHGSDLLDIDPDTRLMYHSGYYERVKIIIDIKVPNLRSQVS